MLWDIQRSSVATKRVSLTTTTEGGGRCLWQRRYSQLLVYVLLLVGGGLCIWLERIIGYAAWGGVRGGTFYGVASKWGFRLVTRKKYRGAI